MRRCTSIPSDTHAEVCSEIALVTPLSLWIYSGIGPQQHLVEKGIPVVHDLPGVGQNLVRLLLIVGMPC